MGGTGLFVWFFHLWFLWGICELVIWFPFGESDGCGSFEFDVEGLGLSTNETFLAEESGSDGTDAGRWMSSTTGVDIMNQNESSKLLRRLIDKG